MAFIDPERPPRWLVTLSALGGFGVGAFVMVNEATRAAGSERPSLLFFAYLLMAGAPVAWALERFRR